MKNDCIIYILLNSPETLYKVSIKETPRPGIPDDFSARLRNRLKLPEKQRYEQDGFLNTASEAAFCSFNEPSYNQPFHAEVLLEANNNAKISFDLNSSSVGLGYALALALERLDKLGEINNFECEVFATGEIHNSGTVTAIGHLVTKINAACGLMDKRKAETGCNKPFIIFFPKENQDSITPEIQQRVNELGGQLSPVIKLQEALKKLLGNSYDGCPEGGQSPFKGLSSFDYKDQRRFFGRECLVNQLIQKYQDADGELLVITGVSGSGKSSVIKAGLIPEIEKPLTDGHSFHWLVTSPKLHNSINELLTHLFEFVVQTWSLNDTAEKLTELAISSPEKLFQQLSAAQRETENNTNHLLCFIDQYEDVFNHSLIQKERAKAKALAPLLEKLSKNVSGLNIIISIRREYLETFGRYGVDIEVPYKLNPEDWQAIVKEQARRSGLFYEEGLISRIINDASKGDNVLSVVEEMLDQLYIKAKKENEGTRELKHIDYDVLGGIQGIITNRAEALLNKHSSLENIFFDYFVGLSTEGLPFAHSVEIAPIESSNLELYNLIKCFIDAQLIIDVDCSGDVTTVKLSHDSLLFQWDRLKKWIGNNINYLEWRKAIDGLFSQWKTRKIEGEFLLNDEQLRKKSECYFFQGKIFQPELIDYISIGNPSIYVPSYPKKNQVYDKNEKLVEVAFYGDDGNLMIFEYIGYAKKTIAYDNNQNVIEEVFFGVDGKLIIPLCGYAKNTITYDAEGKEIESVFSDSAGELMER